MSYDSKFLVLQLSNDLLSTFMIFAKRRHTVVQGVKLLHIRVFLRSAHLFDYFPYVVFYAVLLQRHFWTNLKECTQL